MPVERLDDGNEATSDGTRPSERFAIEESLGYLVNFAAKAFIRAIAAALAPYGVAPAQWAVLVILWAEDELTQKELSRRVAIEEATMVRTLDRMERDGLVQRQRDAQDRRRSRILLTDKGRALRDTLVPRASAVNSTATRDLSPAEQEQLRSLLRRVISPLTEPVASRRRDDA